MFQIYQTSYYLSLVFFIFNLGLNVAQTTEKSLSGHVFDAKSGEILIGATLYDSAKKFSTITNSYGFFSLQLPRTIDTLYVSYIGYELQAVAIDLKQAGLRNIYLEPQSVALEEIELTAAAQDRATLNPAQHTISPEKIAVLPVLFAEPDVQQTLLAQPGVNTVGDGTSGFNVRGGAVDQNLILIDEAPLYNFSHLFGLISVVNTSAINKINFYKAGIPARYGGSASSIVAIRLKEGNQRNFEGAAAINPILSKVSLQIPLVKDKLNVLFSGRRTFLDLLLPLAIPDTEATEDDIKVGFHDMTLKINYKIGEKDKLYLSGYSGSDFLGFQFQDQNADDPDNTDAKFAWGDRLGTLRWNHIFSDKVFSNLTLIRSGYKFRFKSNQGFNNQKVDIEIGSALEGWEAKYDLSYYPKNKLSLYGGLGAKRNSYTRLHLTDSLKKNVPPPRDYGLEYYAYLDAHAQWTPKLKLQIGLRFSGLWNHGPNLIYHYDPDVPKDTKTALKVDIVPANKTVAHYQNPEPRVFIHYQWNEKLDFSFAYDRMVQYTHLLSNSQALAPFDTWTISNKDIPPLLSDQLNFGGNYKHPNWNLTAALYYKTQKNNVVFRENVELFLADTAESLLVPAESKHYGVELSVDKTFKKLKSHLNYTGARSLFRTVSPWDEIQINDGAYFPANYDRPHKFNGIFNYAFNKRVQLNAKFTYKSGRPITLPEGKINGIILYGKRNASRLPDYHRLDLSLTLNRKQKRKKSIHGQWVFSVLNVYARKNPFSYFISSGFANDADRGENTTLRLKQFAVIGAPIPTFSYNIKF